MMRSVLSIILIALCADSFAQDQEESTPTSSSDRKTLLRDLVAHIAVSKRGASEIVWVTYRQGALYRCVDNTCIKFIR
jgi:hypothetical protein